MIHNMTLNSLLLSGFADNGRLLEHGAQSTQDPFLLRAIERRHRILQGSERATTIRSDNVQAGPVRVNAKDRRLP